MPLDNLDELRTFAAVVDAGNMTAAARALRVTNKAVSRRIALLERHAGRRLLQRTTRRLAVTDEGRALYVRCQRVLAEIDEAERELGTHDDLRGLVTVTINPEMVSSSLLAALRQLLTENPELRLQLRTSIHFTEPVTAGLDLIVQLGKPQVSSLVAIPLGMVSWVLAATPAYLRAHGRPKRPEHLLNHQCLRALSDRPELRWPLAREGRRPRSYPVNGRFETDDARAMREALYGGLGIGPRPVAEVEAAQKAGKLERVLPGYRWAPTPLFALVPPGRQRVARVRVVLELLKRSVRELA